VKLITVSAHLVLVAGMMAGESRKPIQAPLTSAERGARWLVATQGKDGGWGQDGGETSYVREGQNMESKGNDAANTAVAAMALMRMGPQYRPQVERAVDFILKSMESAPADGLAITSVQGTQIQRKLGPYIDTFLTSMLFSELDGRMGSAAANARVRAGLQKCVAKIQKNQMTDGSWNLAGGWAPILGTSMASRSLYVAKTKGVSVDHKVMARADEYTKKSYDAGVGAGSGGGAGSGRGSGVVAGALAPSAGIPLYQAAQAMEQMSRTEKDRQQNAKEIRDMASKLGDQRFVAGFGSMGGEEFFSYLNISDSLKRTGGEEWKKWNATMKERIPALQNDDGTWSGHHCITGRVALTSAAMLTLLADRTL